MTSEFLRQRHEGVSIFPESTGLESREVKPRERGGEQDPGSSALLANLLKTLSLSRVSSIFFTLGDVSPSGEVLGTKSVIAAYPDGIRAQFNRFDGRITSESGPPLMIRRLRIDDAALAGLGWPARMLERGYRSLIWVRFPMAQLVECLMFGMGQDFDKNEAGAALWALMDIWPRLKATISAERGILTRREIECLLMAQEGWTALQTSEKLECTERTVRMHLSNAMSKLGAPNTIAAVRRAQLTGAI